MKDKNRVNLHMKTSKDRIETTEEENQNKIAKKKEKGSTCNKIENRKLVEVVKLK